MSTPIQDIRSPQYPEPVGMTLSLIGLRPVIPSLGSHRRSENKKILYSEVGEYNYLYGMLEFGVGRGMFSGG